MGYLERLVLRLVLLFGLPLLLLTLVVGPKRLWSAVKQGWNWITQKRMDPEEILTQVVRQHEQHVVAVRRAVAQAEIAEAELLHNLEQSEANVTALEQHAREHATQHDALAAQADLYKLNLERMAIENFRAQLERQRKLMAESRRRLYLLELQLRQYEVGRSILLSQLAEAKTAEQQYAIANKFDPFNAVADWQKAEGLVQEKALNARAMERVYADTADLAIAGQPQPIDPLVLESQLAELRAELDRTLADKAAAEAAQPPRPRPQTETNGHN
ncbi:MAG: PspA/IM30 family protein [Pirellulales bacterium]|nr:PspA/IM30 family protein [Pirellulales bacterium]